MGRFCPRVQILFDPSNGDYIQALVERVGKELAHPTSRGQLLSDWHYASCLSYERSRVHIQYEQVSRVFGYRLNARPA